MARKVKKGRKTMYYLLGGPYHEQRVMLDGPLTLRISVRGRVGRYEGNSVGNVLEWKGTNWRPPHVPQVA